MLTDKTKWDGVGFCPTSEKKKIGLVLVEFSGGIMFNSTKKRPLMMKARLKMGLSVLLNSQSQSCILC